jgi:hypothetical protein
MTASRFKTAYAVAEASRLCSICVSSTSATLVSHFFFLFLVGELRDGVARTTTRPGERNRRARISASFRSHKPIRNALRPHNGEEGQLIVTYITDLREHAVFALRNILRDSPENQAVVDSFRADEHVVGGTTVM